MGRCWTAARSFPPRTSPPSWRLRNAVSKFCWLPGGDLISRAPVSDLLPCDLHLIVSNGALIKSKSGETHQRLLLPGWVARKVVEALPQYRAEAAVVFDRPGEKQVFLERIDYDDPYRGRYFRRNSHHIGEICR